MPLAGPATHPLAAASDPLALRRHVAAIADLGRLAVSGAGLDELLERACTVLACALAADGVAVLERRGDGLLLRAGRGPTGGDPDLLGADDSLLPQRLGAASGLTVAIGASERPFGALAVLSDRPREFSGDETVFVRLVANVLAAAADAERARASLDGREQLLRTLVEHAPDIVIRFDRELRHLYASPAIAAATGFPPEHFLGRTNRELGMPDELCDLWERELAAVFEQGEPRRIEFEFEGPDGRLWLESYAVPERNDAGEVETVLTFARDRTASHRAELERQASEARYRELFEVALDMIFLLDEDGRYVDVNPAVERELGWSRAELVGRDYRSVVAPGEAESAGARIRRKLDGVESATVYESELVRRDGRTLAVQVSSRAIVREGRPAGVLAIARDVSEQKAALAALEESERRFRSAFDDAAVGMLLTAVDGTLLRVNAALARMLGRDASDLAGATVYDITHPDDIQASSAAIARMAAGLQDALVMDKRYLRRDGEIVWGHVSVSPVRGEDGAVRYFVTQVEDVTELRRVQKELEESQALHRVVIESSRDLITVLDLEGVVRLISRSVEDILGYTQQELIGQRYADLIAPEDVEVAGAALAEALRGGAGTVALGRVRARDGSLRLLEGTASAGFGRDGRPSFLVTSARDVTERVQLEEQLRQAQKLEAIGKLAGGIAHDFNNLLTAINGYSDMVLAALEGGGEGIAHGVTEIRRAGERAAELTRQLLTFSRRQVLRPELVDVNAVVEEYLSMLERLVGEEIELTTSLGPGLPPVHADPGQLGQVLLNLVVNARDAMPAGGRLHVETRALGPDDCRLAALGLETEGCVTLTVRDTGHGMDADTTARVFEPFFTTKEIGKGTGLGLATVHGIVEQSGGAVTVESEPGRGSTFCVFLPAVPEATLAQRPPPGAPPVATGGETVLVVEDEPIVRGLVEELLDSLGYRVLAAATPGEALALAGEPDRIDLVMTDVVMPEMNGHALALRLAELRPGVPVLYTSGYAGDVVEARGVLEASDAFLQKPYSRAALAEKIRSALDSADA